MICFYNKWFLSVLQECFPFFLILQLSPTTLCYRYCSLTLVVSFYNYSMQLDAILYHISAKDMFLTQNLMHLSQLLLVTLVNRFLK